MARQQVADFIRDMEEGGYCTENSNAARRLNAVIRKYEMLLNMQDEIDEVEHKMEKLGEMRQAYDAANRVYPPPSLQRQNATRYRDKTQ